ncbi:GTP-binding protein REM 2-like [Nerophis ophidion]|uniref:GTP-binding protein REM 2-like n=1 Tax=Nerophis ophidion TaxID=159077 RepID=UPI002ADFFE3F|nr:GTP-binding protein REM 2-like [Nerophis ophidion]XP_061743951.1 GTP-binding protein REM 2-like [Nerophis ophidion]
MPTDVPEDGLKTNEDPVKCDTMTLSSTPTVRRGSTPLPIKHQLRREEAVHDDCDWSLDNAGPSASPILFSPAMDDAEPEGRPYGPLRIALLGQNGVGKSSLAFALAGDVDRTASVDSDGEGLMHTVTVDDEESTIVIYDSWRHDLSGLQCEACVLVFSVTDRRSFHRTAQLRLLLRETQPQTPIILVGNKSDLVRSREVTSQEAMTSAALYNCLYLEISASLDHRTQELLECVVRLARGQPPWAPGSSPEDMSGGGQRESITSRAKRFLSSLVPRYQRERDVGRILRQKSRSCHDLGAL